MHRLSNAVKALEDKAEAFWKKHRSEMPRYCASAAVLIYCYSMIVHSVVVGIDNIWNDGSGELFTWNPFENLASVFTPQGLGMTFFLVIMYCLFSKKGFSFLSGYKTIRDKERGIEILPEGTHGTAIWMDKKRAKEVLEVGTLSQVTAPLFGRLPSGEYVGLKKMPGMNENIIAYGSPGTGKSRGFVIPFILQTARRAVQRKESLIMIDPKAEFYETLSKYLEQEGYFVQAYNLLDLFASDGWNFMMDTAENTNLVQNVAEVIIRNTSNDTDKGDFWSTAEKNLLMALILYVQTLTDPITGELLPIEERSLGAIYKLLSSTNVNELDARFRALPPDHPALPPYGIFRQAPHNIWGNIFIGLGSRLNVFQNKLVDSVTKHSEIDLKRPGREKCAYFCIISDQDSSLEFLSSMFFSLLFVELFDFARQQESRRLPVCVNVLMDEFCNIDLLDSKKIFSVARSRNINLQAATQGISQLSNRYPHNEWQEIVGDCDYQLFLGCNDSMTAEYISAQCGNATVRVNNANVPMTPLFSPVLNTTRPYTHSKTSTGRPLMMPDEIRRLPKDELILLMRGEPPLRLKKISPEELPEFHRLIPCKATDHIPLWRKNEMEARREAEKQEGTSAAHPTTEQMPAEESEEYIPTEEELDLNPKIDLSKGIDCKTLTEVSPEEL